MNRKTKWLTALVSSIMLLLPMVNVVNAAPAAGILRGVHYSDASGLCGTSQIGGADYGKETDGNDNTGIVSCAGFGYVTYDVRAAGKPISPSDYYLVADSGVSLQYLDSSMAIIATGLPTGVGSSYTPKSVNNVSFIRVNFSGNYNLYEVDVKADIPDTTPPGVPKGVTAAAGVQQVTVSWGTVTDSDLVSYKLYRDGALIKTLSKGTTTYVDTGLTAGKSYSYQVSAVDDAGNESAKSVAVAATALDVPDTTPPAIPNGLSASAGNARVTLTWNAVGDSDLKGYTVYQDGVKVNASLISTTTVDIAPLTNGKTYSYQVSATDNAGNESAKSTAVTATPDAAFTAKITPNGTSIIVEPQNGTAPFRVDWGTGPQTFSGAKYYITGLTKSTNYSVTVTDANNKSVTQTVNTGSAVGALPPVMPDSSTVFQKMVNSFGNAGSIALYVIGGAVALGVIVILGLWAWRLTKKWLARSK